MSELKTIEDAFRELGGDLSNSQQLLKCDKFLYFHPVDGYICFEYKSKDSLLTYICTVEEFKNYKGKDEGKVYTQAMSDAEELPSVGCRVIYNCRNPRHKNMTDNNIEHHKKELTVVAIDGRLLVLISDDKSFVTACNDQWILPIDTRTTEEKAIDQMICAYNKSNDMGDVISEIKKGYIKGVSFKGEEE